MTLLGTEDSREDFIRSSLQQNIKLVPFYRQGGQTTIKSRLVDPAYVTPVKGAKEELAKTDPEMAANTLIFPDEETLSQVKQFDNAALENDEYITLWQGVLGQ